MGIEATFKEKRYLINPERLSIVAFVQDEKTKEILQAVYFEGRICAGGVKETDNAIESRVDAKKDRGC